MKELLLKHWKLIGVLIFISYLAIANNVKSNQIGKLKDEKHNRELILKADSIAELEKKNYILQIQEDSIRAYLDSLNIQLGKDSLEIDSINKHYDQIITNIDSFSLSELIEFYPISE